MNIRITVEERWPEYILRAHGTTDFPIEVSEEDYERFKKAIAEYKQVQYELSRLYFKTYGEYC